jgi:hypothetical protein
LTVPTIQHRRLVGLDFVQAEQQEECCGFDQHPEEDAEATSFNAGEEAHRACQHGHQQEQQHGDAGERTGGILFHGAVSGWWWRMMI